MTSSAANNNLEGRDAASLDELLALRHQAPRPVAGARARSTPAGGHVSHLHARGVDYAESRIYQPGDDIRAMDWRVTARSGKPHTKLFREERERALFVLVDFNPSMRFGTRVRFKSVQALRGAALAAWSAVRAGDRVGALGFGGVRDVVHPRSGPRGALAVLGALLRWDASTTSAHAVHDAEPLSEGLHRCLRVARGGSRVLLISDGFSSDQGARAPLLRLCQHAEVTCLGVVDALESAPPPRGRFAVETDRGRLRLQLDNRGSRLAFAQTMSQGRRQLEALCNSCAVPMQVVNTADSAVVSVGRLLGLRPGGRR